jgi:hypothetical protein
MQFRLSLTRTWKLGLLSAFLICVRFSTAADVTVGWDPSPSTNVVAYRVYYGMTAGAYASMMQVAAPATTAMVSSLTAGATYFFAAKAVDAAGVESSFSNEASVAAAVVSTNIPPTVNAPPGMIVTQNAGPQVVPLTGISSGSTTEAQTVRVSAASSNPSVVPTPTVSYASPNSTGTLTYAPRAAGAGWSTISIIVDDGGVTNSVTTNSFWVLVNNPPTLNPISDIAINEDSGTRTVALAGISSGATNEVQPLSVTAYSNNPGLIPDPTVSYTSPNSAGTLTFAPMANAIGRATIKVIVSDGQYGNNYVVRWFTVTVGQVNDAPTLNAIPNMTIDSGAGSKVVTLSGISSGAPNENQPLFVKATSSNRLLIATPTVAYVSPSSTGTLILTPVLNQTGTATISVTVSDGWTNTTTRTFNVTLSSAVPKISGVTVEPLDARTMRVAWNTDRSAIGSVAYGLTTTVPQVSGSTSGTSHSVTLTNLEPGTLYFLQPRAWSSAGTGTAAATATTEARQGFQWAAESGTLTGPVKVYSSAETENGGYVASSVANKNGIAAFTLNLAKGPNYRMWARVKTSVGGGTIGAAIDGALEKQFFVGDDPFNRWHWALVMDDANRSNAITLPLAAGSHTFTMNGALTAWWDEFLLSNDPLWQPILPTTRPVLTAARTSAQSAVLNWSDPSGNAASVSIEFSTDGVNFQPFTGVAASQKTVTLVGLSPRTYYFRVFSYNTLDRTAYSNVAAALY